MNTSDPQSIALVVDDSPESLGPISTVLAENGITVIVARDGRPALHLADRVRPDVILMAAVMPGMDGFGTCRRRKDGPTRTAAPIIFMIGLTESCHIVAAPEAGGVDDLRKPVVVEELLARITTHILTAKMIHSTQEALDTSGGTLAAFNSGGQLAWSTPNAVALLGDTAALAADQEFRLWLRDCLWSTVSEVEPRGAARAQMSFIGLTSAREMLVRLSADGDGDGAPTRSLRGAFNLTTREAEVLKWLSFGKTIRDIGQILSLSSRTVNKYLERIFQKMASPTVPSSADPAASAAPSRCRAPPAAAWRSASGRAGAQARFNTPKMLSICSAR
jgi:DNA-binding response OmpR family regulator/DNA-binding CsgD family transcriptional regulator